MSIASKNEAARIPFLDLKTEYASLCADGLEEAMLSILRNANYIEGPAVREFETRYAAFCGVSEGIAVDSGTAALHLALLAANIGAGDEVIVPAHTFIATAAAVAMVGATPVFVDADPLSWQMDVTQIAARVTPRTRAVIGVHLFGQPLPMEALLAVCAKHNLMLIEDAAQAHGASFRGQRVGSFGRMACFSFYPAKNLGAFGDAGMVVTGDSELAARLRRLRNHGRLTKYEHSEVGYNYRMDELQGRVLAFKLPYLQEWTRRRREIAGIYRQRLASLPLFLPQVVAETDPVYHLFPTGTALRNQLVKFLDEQQIDSGMHYPVPLHLQPAFAHLKGRRGDFPVAEKIGDEELSLPIGPFMTDEQVDRVCTAVSAFFDNRQR